MSRKAENSPKAERDKVRDRMRGLGCTVAQIAAEFSRRFSLRPRVAWRYALGWPQWKLAQQYNTLHPGMKLSESRVSEFEAWPHGGCPPTLRYLVRLAATYGHGCTAALLVDAADLEHLNPADRCLLTTGQPPEVGGIGAPAGLPASAPARRNRRTGASAAVQPGSGLISVQPGSGLVAVQPGSGLVVPAEHAVWEALLGLHLPADLAALVMTCLEFLMAADDDAPSTPSRRDRVYHRLVQSFSSWAHTMKRRLALRSLGWAVTAASVGHLLDPDEQVRLAAIMNNPGRVDEQTIEHIDAVLWNCRIQEAALGPHAVLDTVLAQRQLARSLLSGCPSELKPRLLSALSAASRQAGWLLFDLDDLDGAEYYYEDARTLAHDAQDIELGAFVLCEMSYLATWQGKPRIGIDHAAAAEQWASHTGHMRLRAFAADITARAYAADGQRDACLTALDTSHTTLSAAPAEITPHPIHFYRYDEAIHNASRGFCHLRLRDIQPAADYAQQSLRGLDPSHVRNIAFTNAFLGTAYAQIGEVDEATRLLGDAGEIAALNNWARLIVLLKQGRTDLQPWQDSAAVRALDDRLTSCGVA